MSWLRPTGLLIVTSVVVVGGACGLSTQGLESTSNGFGGSATGSSSSSGSTSGGGCAAGTKRCGGVCVSTNDPDFGCGGASCDGCTNAHGSTACAAGLCAPTCSEGFADCDGVPSDGCETEIKTVTDCGSCGVACTNAHGTTDCVSGKCEFSCDVGFADCNGDPSDGCEADLASAAACGACGVTCTNAHGATACNGGKCVFTCDSGFDDCNNDASDGCETSTSTDVSHCGACGRACSPTDVAALACSGGVCTSSCVLGRANCAQPAAPDGDDGCELDVSANDSANCGGCGNSCISDAVTDDPECDRGTGTQKMCGCSGDNECKWGSGTSPSCDNTTGICTCNNVACQPGEACKHDGASDVCTCYGGAACAAGQSCCQTPSGCFDLKIDASNCGACGHACAPGFACSGGVCICGANDANCNGGAAAGTFACPPISGPDVCVCKSGATTCLNGQRCLADDTCG